MENVQIDGGVRFDQKRAEGQVVVEEFLVFLGELGDGEEAEFWRFRCDAVFVVFLVDVRPQQGIDHRRQDATARKRIR